MSDNLIELGMDAQGKPKILIIEDNADLVEMYDLKFNHEGFNVHTATDGEKGILAAVEHKPDVILLDLLMPNMDGFQVLKAIRDNTGLEAKIIVLSNLGQQDQIQRAFDLGATEYLVKANYQPSEVVTKVRDMLGIKPAQAPAPVQQSSGIDVTEKLKELKKLLDEGVITSGEFEELKKKIIGSL
jgi:DNA-binding response OmpR family regulator